MDSAEPCANVCALRGNSPVQLASTQIEKENKRKKNLCEIFFKNVITFMFLADKVGQRKHICKYLSRYKCIRVNVYVRITYPLVRTTVRSQVTGESNQGVEGVSRCHGMWNGSTRRMDTSCHGRECQGIWEISMRHSGILLMKYKHSMVGKTQYPLPLLLFQPSFLTFPVSPTSSQYGLFYPRGGATSFFVSLHLGGFFLSFFLLLESHFYCSFCSSNT